jgi:hypothetical protein
MKEAIDTLKAYNTLPPGTPRVTIQQFRDDLNESRKTTADTMIDLERDYQRKELQRKVESSKLYFKYRADKFTEEGTRQRIIQDTEELMQAQIDAEHLFKQVRNLVEALKDAANSAASRLKLNDD